MQETNAWQESEAMKHAGTYVRELMICFAIVGVLVFVFHGAQIIASVDVALHNAGFQFQRTNLKDLIFGFEKVGTEPVNQRSAE